jgi:hypothetical protein
MSRVQALSIILASAGMIAVANAQETLDLGRPPPSGSQNPVLPPPSGSQNPVLPPPSGQRYRPGIGGPFGEGARRPAVPSPYPGLDQGLSGSVSPVTRSLEGDVVDRISEIGPALRRCWTPPEMAGNDGAMATVRFSLRRDGTIFGQPRVTWETRRSNPDLQAAFTASILAAVRNCTPMRLSPRFGASIAGRPFTIRFHGRAPSNERPI